MLMMKRGFLCLMMSFFLWPAFFYGQKDRIKHDEVIDASLKEAIQKSPDKADDSFPVFVLFKKQGDRQEFDRLFGDLGKAQRREKNTAWLKNLSDTTFMEFKNWLDRNPAAADIKLGRRFWLVNGLEVTASRRAVHEISSRPGIAKLYLRTEKPPEFKITGKKNANLFTRDLPKRPSFKGPFFTEGKQINWNLKAIQADEVWKQGYTGRGVVVAILDGGMSYGHTDVKNNLWVNEKEIPENGKDDDHNGYVDDYLGWNFAENNQNIEDLTGHGTTCGAIIVGDGTGGTITGVAPQASLMVMKYYTRYNTEDIRFRTIWEASQFDAWEALQYALDQGAHVASLSMSYDQDDDPPHAAWRFVGSNATSCGLTLVAAAGNDRERYKQYEQVNLPGSLPDAISVGGFRQDGYLSPYSSSGPVTWASVSPFLDFPLPEGLMKPDVCAPLEDFPDISVASRGYSYPGGGGTSSATPHVAGVVALMLEKDPELMPWEIKKRLEETSVDRGIPFKDNFYGSGLVDAWEAVNYGSGPNFSLPEMRLNRNHGIYVLPGEDFDITLKLHIKSCPVSRVNAVLHSPGGELKIISQDLTLSDLPDRNQTLVLSVKAITLGTCPDKKKVFLDLVLNTEKGKKCFYRIPVYIGHADLLIVKDDGQGENEKAVLETLDHAGRYYNVINTREASLEGQWLNGYRSVIWLTGEEFVDTLDEREQALVKEYLGGGGNLILFGENIGEDIGNTEFFRDYLHAKLVKGKNDKRKENPFIVIGKKGDPISRRLTLTMRNYYGHEQFDVIRPLPGADDPFRAEQEEDYWGFVRFSGKYKLVYSSLGLGFISDYEVRSKLLDRILEWMGD